MSELSLFPCDEYYPLAAVGGSFVGVAVIYGKKLEARFFKQALYLAAAVELFREALGIPVVGAVFVLLDEIEEDKLYFVFELRKNGEWQKQKLNDMGNYKDFINAKTFDEQKEKFADLIQAAKEKLKQ